MLKIENLHVKSKTPDSSDQKEKSQQILNGINLNIKQDEIHVIMGPNGSGKSTLVKTIIGHPFFEISNGHISYHYNRKSFNLLEVDSHQRALMGIFLSFQYPVEIPGVDNFSFLKASFESICHYQGAEILKDEDFKALLVNNMEFLNMDKSFLNRGLNAGFSGGEKKKNEILQLLTLNPKLALLDETDSGLDVDSLKIVASGINRYKNKNNSVILVTHYQRLLDYINVDYIHILHQGKIIKSAGNDLAKEIEKKGYDYFIS